MFALPRRRAGSANVAALNAPPRPSDALPPEFEGALRTRGARSRSVLHPIRMQHRTAFGRARALHPRGRRCPPKEPRKRQRCYRMGSAAPMATFNYPRELSQFAHFSENHWSHERDKREAEKRKEMQWIAVPRTGGPVRPLPSGVLSGFEIIRENETWRRCESPHELPEFLAQAAASRRFRMSQTRRNGKTVKMKRPVDTPIHGLCFTLSPPAASWCAAAIRAGRNPQQVLERIFLRFGDAVCETLHGVRDVKGAAVHFKTRIPHMHVAFTHISGDGSGTRIGPRALGIIGPWMTGVDRQRRFGAKISRAKQEQFERAAANFRRRFKDRSEPPLDILLTRKLDEICAEEMGPSLKQFIDAYAERVPALEAAHRKAALATLDAARRRLEQEAELDAPESVHRHEPQMPPTPALPPISYPPL